MNTDIYFALLGIVAYGFFKTLSGWRNGDEFDEGYGIGTAVTCGIVALFVLFGIV